MSYYVKTCLSLGLKLSLSFEVNFFGGYQVLQGNKLVVEWVIALDPVAVAVHVLVVKLSTGITLVLVSSKQ